MYAHKTRVTQHGAESICPLTLQKLAGDALGICARACCIPVCMRTDMRMHLHVDAQAPSCMLECKYARTRSHR